MTGADILLICVVSGAATAFGWIAARMTHNLHGFDPHVIFQEPARKYGRGPRPHLGQKLADTNAASNTALDNSLTFVAVIRFPGFPRFRQNAGDIAADTILRDYADSLVEACPSIVVHRTGVDTIECNLIAASAHDAEHELRKALDALLEVTPGIAYEHTQAPRAGISPVSSLPAPQSAIDAASLAVDTSNNPNAKVVVGNASNGSHLRKSPAETVQMLREALKGENVSLVYQPKLNVREQTFTTSEALFRWDSDFGRHISIGELIISAEKHGGIRDLTLWSLKRAMSDQLTLMDHGVEMTTFVNLSGNLISDSDFTLEAIEIIKAASGRIGIEITETSVIEHSGRALANLGLFSAAGAEIAIDDYGTGLSSLRYLKRIPAQELKIDREFIKDLTDSHRDPMIVRSTIDLAHALGLKVTAEGVDDPTKMALLKVMGCDTLQGFHIAKPMTLTALIEFMSDHAHHNSLMNSEVSLLPGRAAAGKL